MESGVLIAEAPGKLYSIHEIVRLKELEEFLPKREGGEFDAFLESVRRVGEIMEPVHVWVRGHELVLVDGYTRLRVAEFLGLLFKIVKHEFGSIEDVKEWMISRQSIERRNLTPWQKAYYIGYYYSKVKIKPGRQSKLDIESTMEKVAQHFGTSDSTVKRAVRLFEGIEYLMAHNNVVGNEVKLRGEELGVNRNWISTLIKGIPSEQLTALQNVDQLLTLQNGQRTVKSTVVSYDKLLQKVYKDCKPDEVNEVISLMEEELKKLRALLK